MWIQCCSLNLNVTWHCVEEENDNKLEKIMWVAQQNSKESINYILGNTGAVLVGDGAD